MSIDVNSNIFPGLFKAYDIRGVVETHLRPEVVKLIGQALATLHPQCKRLVVGRDGRLTSAKLADSLIAGLMSAGIEVIDIGEVPTPVLYFATHYCQTGSGLMITGSHNPPEYNGIKMVMAENTLFGDMIQDIYQCILTGDFAQGQGSYQRMDILDAYIDTITADIKLDRPLNIAVDCGNGVAGPSALKLFQQLGCQVTPLFCEIDGTFPNHHPNPSEVENFDDLINTVDAHSLDLGLAFDGDGDRVGIIDDQGDILFPDRQMMLYAEDVLSRNPGAEIIFDVKSTRNLAHYINQAGGKATMWKTGHSFMKKKMKETGALLAGEMSGHIFFKERWFGFDDGLYAAARMLEIIAKQAQPTSTLFSQLPNDINTPEIVVHLAHDGQQHEFIQRFVESCSFTQAEVSTIDGIRADFPDGWGLVRASNTTPSIVIRFEAKSEAALTRIKNEFKRQILAIDNSLNLPI